MTHQKYLVSFFIRPRWRATRTNTAISKTGLTTTKKFLNIFVAQTRREYEIDLRPYRETVSLVTRWDYSRRYLIAVWYTADLILLKGPFILI